ncbi:MAG: fimbrial biogenesis outer membrane usher protein [Alphaproteobacteria bacterium]|nr:fimbrial biogenesis outer membrane usher protein [Alphaproteobacteria bacterium]
MRKPSLAIETRFLGKVFGILVVLDIVFSANSLADPSLEKRIESTMSDFKVSDAQYQKLLGSENTSQKKVTEVIQDLIGRADVSKDKPEKVPEIAISDIPLKKEEIKPVIESREEEDINDAPSDLPDLLPIPKVVQEEQNNGKNNDDKGSDLPKSIEETDIVPDAKNKEIESQELPKAVEVNEKSREESGLIDMGDGKKYEQSIVSLKVNYEESDILSTILKDQSNNLLVLAEDMTPFDIKEEYLDRTVVNLNDKKYINLTSLTGTKYSLDSGNLALDITIPAEQMKKQYFNTTPNPVTNDIYGKSTKGAFLNYDLVLSRNENTTYASALNDFNYFTDKGILFNSFFIKKEVNDIIFIKAKSSKKVETQLTRLETNWTFDNVNDMARWRIGDSLTKAADWSGSTRFIGLQYSTNFSVRPDLITHPLASFQGRADLPSIFDVYANNLPIYRGETQTGDFEIANLPVITGKGELVVKTQDITGVVRTITMPYYSSPSLLKTGLADYSFEAGIARKDFGLISNKYKDLVTSANYRYGMNDYWTSAVHFELLKNYSSIGTTHDIQLGNYGLISTSIASNIYKVKNAQKGSLGYNYQSDKYNFNFTVSKAGKNYSDIYNALAKTSTEPSYQTSVGYNHEKLGSIFVGFLSFAPYNGDSESKRVKIISTTYNKNITKNSSLNFTVGTNLANQRKESFVYLSFNANLGNKSLSLNNSNQNGVSTKQFSYNDPVGNKLGWGYRATLLKGLTEDYDLQLDRQGEKGNASLFLYRYGGSPVQQLEFMGALVGIDGGLYRTQPIYNSMALVKVGEIKGVPVYNNNMLVGYTDSKGKVLVPDVLPYVPSEIRLDQRKLPLDSNFASLSAKTAPKWKTGVVIDFEVNRVKSAEMVLIDSSNKVVNFDRDVTIEGIEENLFVGYGGKVYISDIKNLTLLKGTACEGDECCNFEVPINSDSKEPILDLGEVTCH